MTLATLPEAKKSDAFDSINLHRASRAELVAMIEWNDRNADTDGLSHRELAEMIRDMRIDSSHNILESLRDLLRSWCAINRLDFVDADELLGTYALTQKQRAWLKAYIALHDQTPAGV